MSELFQEGAVQDPYIGTKHWGDLTIVEQDEFLLSCLNGDWASTAIKLGFKWFTANSISIPFTAILESNRAYNNVLNQNGFIERLASLAGTNLSKRTERAIAREKGFEFNDDEPFILFDPPRFNDEEDEEDEHQAPRQVIANKQPETVSNTWSWSWEDNKMRLGCLFIVVFAITQFTCGGAGIINQFGYLAFAASILMSFIFRFHFQWTIGMFFCAKNIFEWHWLAASIFAAPFVALIFTAQLVAIPGSLFKWMTNTTFKKHF
jgi:hypothetical protein